jgi:3-oxoacyl-[acyl-carrier protein] reductase
MQTAHGANGRRVIVTGGSRGIGASIVAKLSSDGWTVLAPPRDELDLLDPQSIDLFVSSIRGNVDGLVLNAGINEPAGIESVSDGALDRLLDVNLKANFRLLRAMVPDMAQRGFGRVVGISSLYAHRARGGRAAYSMTKAALESLLRSVSAEFAQSGVLANAVAPGFVATEMTMRNNSPEVINQLLERVPVGRLAAPPEIADAVAFLMSPSNTYITGQVLVVDGGWQNT